MTGWLPTLAWVAVVVVYAVLANAWNRRDPGWYDALPRPVFQPPDVVFGVVWPLNFLAMTVAGVWFTRSQDLVAASLTWAGVLLVPYAVWLVVATALSVQYACTARRPR